MNIHENVATQALTSFFYHEALWKKEILFNFLLQPFDLKLADVKDVITQDNLKETIPDFTIVTNTGKRICYEVKINDAELTLSERKKDSRDAYLVCRNYNHLEEIPISKDKILFWDDLFELIDKIGATKEFARFDLVREYIKIPFYSLLLTPHEVAMFYSPDTIYAVYSLSEKLLKLCESFLDKYSIDYTYEKRTDKMTKGSENNQWGIGYYFSERKNKKRNFFIGLSPCVNNKNYYYSIALQIEETRQTTNWYVEDEYAFFSLDKEILAKCKTDEELQEAFNKNVLDTINSIK